MLSEEQQAIQKTPGLLLAPFSRYIKTIERQTQMQEEKMRNARGRANEVYIGTRRRE
jgi:hypothetical protein